MDKSCEKFVCVIHTVMSGYPGRLSSVKNINICKNQTFTHSGGD